MPNDWPASLGFTRRGLRATTTLGTRIIVGIAAAVMGDSASDVAAHLIAIPIGTWLFFWLTYSLLRQWAARLVSTQPGTAPPPTVLPESEEDIKQAKAAPVTARTSLSIAIGRSCAPFAAVTRFFSRILG